MKNKAQQPVQITKHDKATLTALSLPALLLAFGLGTADVPDANVVVAGGTDVSVAEIAATHACQYTSPCFVNLGDSDPS